MMKVKDVITVVGFFVSLYILKLSLAVREWVHALSPIERALNRTPSSPEEMIASLVSEGYPLNEAIEIAWIAFESGTWTRQQARSCEKFHAKLDNLYGGKP